MKTSELTGAALDWAVAKCEQITVLPKKRGDVYCTYQKGNLILLAYSTDWSQGGPIIEREKTNLSMERESLWVAEIFAEPYYSRVVFTRSGTTPLIAAMRCYVASKLGDEVEIPEELTCV